MKRYISVADNSCLFILAKGADTDEMSTYVTFHLGLHCAQSIVLPVSITRRIKSSYCILSNDPRHILNEYLFC